MTIFIDCKIKSSTKNRKKWKLIVRGWNEPKSSHQVCNLSLNCLKNLANKCNYEMQCKISELTIKCLSSWPHFLFFHVHLWKKNPSNCTLLHPTTIKDNKNDCFIVFCNLGEIRGFFCIPSHPTNRQTISGLHFFHIYTAYALRYSRWYFNENLSFILLFYFRIHTTTLTKCIILSW